MAPLSQVLGRKITLSRGDARAERASDEGARHAGLAGCTPRSHRANRQEWRTSTENTKPIYDIVKRAPLTTKQFVEDHKAFFA
jgi:hypothetical protein